MADLSLSSTTATPAGAGPARAAVEPSQELNERFLTLLVAQMKNQDPLNPTDNAQITSQIAQINTVTGINDLNDTLDKITGQIDTTQRLQASALIGHRVLVPGDTVKVGDDGTATPFGVNLAGDAARLTVTITDDAGNLVHQSEYTDQSAGVQSFQWDGQTASDAKADPGAYHLSLSAVGADGSAVSVTPLSTGYVNGVVAGAGSTQLDLGPGGVVSLDDVEQIL